MLAATGVVVAKHGNRGSRVPNGSFDLLEKLGIPVELGADSVSRCLEQTGLAFIYARTFHPALKRMVEPRALAARRTIFNLAGPLSNPTSVTTQVVGTPTRADALLVSQCLHLMGRSGFAVVGHGGLDDVDLSGPALLVRAASSPAVTGLDPISLGVPRTSVSELPGGNAETNAELFRLLFEDRAPTPLRQLVCVSASVAFVSAARAQTYSEGYALASELLSTGKAKAKYVEYRAVAASCATLSSNQ